MQLICKHDPADPDHLICESKHSPLQEWFRKRYRQFYCVGPTCPPHRAYTHLWVDLLLVGMVLALLISNLVILNQGRKRAGAGEGLERKIERATLPAALPPPEPPEEPKPEEEPVLSLEAEAQYFSAEGEQLGRGPWPPRAGETTKVKVIWKPVIVGEFNNIRVSGELDQNSAWTGFVPLGQRISFEPAGRTVLWLPQDDPAAVFEVAVTPLAEQLAGGELIILHKLRISGIVARSGLKKEILLPNVVLTLASVVQ